MSARDDIYATLRDRLTSGHYADDRPLVPAALSEEFGVSRTPVREALGLLEREGLLVATRRGFVFNRRSDEETLEIFEVRAILESAAASAAALRRSPIDLARLEALATRAREQSDPAAVRQLYNQWHDAIRTAAHNETIIGLLRILDAQAKSSAPWKVPDPANFEESHAEHQRIQESIGKGDAEAARVQMLDHLAHDRDTRIQQMVANKLNDGPAL